MKNPVTYFKHCIGKVRIIDKEIKSKKAEIKHSQDRLDEIKSKKDSTNFKWYEFKNKTDFKEDLKSEKKLQKETITKLEKEIKDFEKQRKEAKRKTESFILWTAVAIFVIIIVLAITAGSINEKNNPQPETQTTFATISDQTETTEETEKITESTSQVDTTNLETTIQDVITETAAEDTSKLTTSRLQKIVYGSKTGNHYHVAGCRYANGQELTIEQAESKGWEPCGICNP